MSVLKGQLSVPGTPISFTFTKKSAEKIPESDLGTLDISSLIKNDSLEGVENRYAKVHYVNIDIKRDGLKTNLPGKGNLWRYSFSSGNAYSIGIAFSQFWLPQGATVFIYNPEKTIVLGAFTSLNNRENHYLKIAELFSNSAIIEYFEPEGIDSSGQLAISEITLAYRYLNKVGVPNYDIVCPDWVMLQDVKHSVCRMTFTSGQYSYYCTGALINNTNFDEKPYFLTAAHCIDNAQSAASLVTYFNYEAVRCGGEAPNGYQTLSGATINMAVYESDVSLLSLEDKPPKDYNPYYAGWDVSGKETSNVYGVHHPHGDLKEGAFARSSIKNVSTVISWDSGPDSPANTHWQVFFSLGATQSGSSGSPLFNKDLQIIGQLHGGNEQENYYGKLSVSWKYGSNPKAQLKTYLDPNNTGVISISGIYGYSFPMAGFKAYPLKACVNAPVVFTDTSLYTPSKWKWEILADSTSYLFVNGTSSESKNPQIVFKEQGNYPIKLTVSNKNGSSDVTNVYQAIDTLNFELTSFPASPICGYQLKNTKIIASGAANYSFQLSPKEFVDTLVRNNTITLNIKEEAFKNGSFQQKVIVRGSHGSCHAEDSISFFVTIPAYDRAEDAKLLPLGKSGPFNNECASVELFEPHPGDGGCLSEKSWCYDPANSNVINKTLWFQFIGPNNGTININTSGFDTRIAVYKSKSAADLMSGLFKNYEIIAANDNPSASIVEASLANLKVEPGLTYWLQVDAYKAATGDLYLNLFNNDLDIYPNPSSGIFNLSLAREYQSAGTLEIYSSFGTLVFKKNISNSPESVIETIDLRTKSVGVYTAVVNLGGARYIRKLLLVK